MSEELVADPARAAAWHVEGDPPWFPNLAEVMDPAPELLDRLVGEFAPMGAELKTQTAWWTAFQMYATEALVGDAVSGAGRDSLRQAAWVVHATTYWGSLEQQAVYGAPLPLRRMGFEPAAPDAAAVANQAAKLAARHALLAQRGDALFSEISAPLREAPAGGVLHGAAYNTSFLEVIAEAPPLGERPAHLEQETGFVRIDPRNVLRIDYAIPLPAWLRDARTAFEAAARAHPDALETLIAGDGELKDLRLVWRDAHAFGHQNWGGDAITTWTQPYFDELLSWSTVLNFAIEGVALATFAALLNRDEALARRAVTGNALIASSSGAYIMGYLDPAGTLPELVPT